MPQQKPQGKGEEDRRITTVTMPHKTAPLLISICKGAVKMCGVQPSSMAAIQTGRTSDKMGTQTPLPLPASSTKTTKARG